MTLSDLSTRRTEGNHDLSSTSRKVTRFLVRATILASIGGILFGYDLGVISGALPSLKSSLDLNKKQTEHIVSMLYVGMIIGSIVGGVLCDRIGRRKTILLTDSVFVIASIMLCSAHSFEGILIGRLAAGAGMSISAISDVAYLTEISPEEHRGAIVSCHEASISFGFLVAYISSFVITIEVDQFEGWRLMFLLSGGIAMLQFIGIFGMPESPVWLRMKGRIAESKAALAIIYKEDEKAQDNSQALCDFSENDGDLFSPVEGDDPYEKNDKSKKTEVPPSGSTEVFADEPNVTVITDGTNFTDTTNEIESSSKSRRKVETSQFWRQAIIVSSLAVSQQTCGHATVLNFAPEIFSQIFYNEGIDGIENDLSKQDTERLLAPTVLLGCVKFIITCVVIFKVDVLGRRRLLLIGAGTIVVSMLCLVIAFTTGLGSIDGSFTMTQQILALVGCMGVVAGYALSYGPLFWLLTSELFPVSIRGRALGSAQILSSLFAVITSYTFLSVQDAFGAEIPFEIYFILSIFNFIFAALAVPDTVHAEADEHPNQINVLLEELFFWKHCTCISNRGMTSELVSSLEDERNTGVEIT
mmetsp:Transcript_19727/g.30422  ORF Transcript_19727/g.30422 Transcript_19727/m.30422 type:complete len:585 (+) Transcript_19727:109-1863(+)